MVLGFKKVPFHLGINKFVPEIDSPSELEYQFESKNQEEIYDDEDIFPYSIPVYLSTLFLDPNDFLPHVSTTKTDSNSTKTTTDAPLTQLGQGESSHTHSAERVDQNQDDTKSGE